MKILIEENRSLDDINIYITLLELYKSYLLFISDQKELGIGNVSLGSPPSIEGIKTTSASYKLFGLDKKLISTIIVERTSYILKAPVLLLLFIKSQKEEEEIIKPIITFLNEVLSEIISTNKE